METVISSNKYIMKLRTFMLVFISALSFFGLSALPYFYQQIFKSSILSQQISEYFKKDGLKGSVAITKNDKTLINAEFGYTINSTPPTFMIASNTKSFVATGIMQLQEQGKLNIHDPISKYIPGFPNGNHITLYNFLTHTSGISTFIWEKTDNSPESLIKEIEKGNIKFPAGAKYDYLDENYMVLGYVLEKVTKMPLHQYIEKYILEPAGIKNAVFSSSYEFYGCADMYMTPLDLSLFDQALLHGKLVSQESLKEMETPTGLSPYGLGLFRRNNWVYNRGILGNRFSYQGFDLKNHISVVVFLDKKPTSQDIDDVATYIYKLTIE